MNKPILPYSKTAPPPSKTTLGLAWGAIACGIPFWIALVTYLAMRSEARILPSTLAPLCFFGFFLGLAATIKSRGRFAVAWMGLGLNAVVVAMFAFFVAFAKYHH